MDDNQLASLVLRSRQNPDYENAVVVRCDQIEWMAKQIQESKSAEAEIKRLKTALKKIRRETKCKKSQAIALEAIDR